ncbi:MAG TPA: hypothetical protein VIM73_03840 [Polyangiaceae bacterium]
MTSTHSRNSLPARKRPARASAENPRAPEQELDEDEEGYAGAMDAVPETLASDGDSDTNPVVDAGVPVNPEDLGVKFLHDATEQGNYESLLDRAERDPGAYPLGQMISESTLEMAHQAGRDIPRSTALGDATGEFAPEPMQDEVLLTRNVVEAGSLFDEPTEVDEGTGVDVETPALLADEAVDFDEHRGPPTVDEEERAREAERLRAVLHRAPDRRDPLAHRESWEDNRRAGSNHDGFRK